MDYVEFSKVQWSIFSSKCSKCSPTKLEDSWRWGHPLVCHSCPLPLQQWLIPEMSVCPWSGTGWVAQCRAHRREGETRPLQHSHGTGPATPPKPNSSKTQRWFWRTFVSERLSLGVESFLAHLEFKAFQWLHYTVKPWMLSGSQRRGITNCRNNCFTLGNLEVKIGCILSPSQKRSTSRPYLASWQQSFWWTQHYRIFLSHSEITEYFSNRSGGNFYSLIMIVFKMTQLIIFISFRFAGS